VRKPTLGVRTVTMNETPKHVRRLASAVLCGSAAFTPAFGQTSAPPTMIEVPLKVAHGNLLVEARINGSEPLVFKLDTGFGITTIHPDRVEALRLERVGKMTIHGIAGEEEAATYAGAVFEFGAMKYAPRRVAVLPSEGRRRWRKRDGILGAGFFRRFVVEIDLGAQRLRLHEPEQFTYAGTGEVIPIEFKRDTPIVEAEIVPEGRTALPARLEIDTGCDGCVCLGHEFVAANRLIETANPGSGDRRRGVGGSAEIREGGLAELRLGKVTVRKPAASFFLEGSPAGAGQAGHVGLGALEGFRMIFDYSRKQMILEAQR